MLSVFKLDLHIHSIPSDIFGKKKDKLRPRFTPDAHGLRGGLSWRVVIEDHGGAAQAAASSNSSGNDTRSISHVGQAMWDTKWD